MWTQMSPSPRLTSFSIGCRQHRTRNRRSNAFDRRQLQSLRWKSSIGNRKHYQWIHSKLQVCPTYAQCFKLYWNSQFLLWLPLCVLFKFGCEYSYCKSYYIVVVKHDNRTLRSIACIDLFAFTFVLTAISPAKSTTMFNASESISQPTHRSSTNQTDLISLASLATWM